MSYYQALTKCICCNQLFSFNPDKVPSVRIDGIREPICKECVAIINPKRIAVGLEPIHILPGAYEPAPEFLDDIILDALELELYDDTNEDTIN